MVRSALGATVREIQLHRDRMRLPDHGHRLVIFPSHTTVDGSSNLRAYNIGEGLKAAGWRIIICPPHFSLGQRQRLLRLERPHAILLQKTYHPLNRASLYKDIPIIFDLDDADYLDPERRQEIVECCEKASLVITGSTALARWCSVYNDNVQVVWTGTPISAIPSRLSERSPIITWAASQPYGYPAEAAFLTVVLREVVTKHGAVRFRIYADDGTLAFQNLCKSFQDTGVILETRPSLSYPHFLESISECTVGLSPLMLSSEYSGGKSFGKVLAYLDKGVPIVTHPLVDHPYFFRDGENAFLKSTATEWADAIGELLTDADQAQRLADQARADFIARLSVNKAVELVGQAIHSLFDQPFPSHSHWNGADPLTLRG